MDGQPISGVFTKLKTNSCAGLTARLFFHFEGDLPALDRTVSNDIQQGKWGTDSP